jgi:hypothetical protein
MGVSLWWGPSSKVSATTGTPAGPDTTGFGVAFARPGLIDINRAVRIAKTEVLFLISLLSLEDFSKTI